MLDETQVRAQLATFQRQLDWLTGSIDALKAVLGELPQPPPKPDTPEPQS